MDIATLIGFMIAAGGILFAMYEGTHGDFRAFYSTEGFVLVMGGAIEQEFPGVRSIREFKNILRR